MGKNFFRGITIAVTGGFGRGVSHGYIRELVENHGATWSDTIADGVTHLVTTGYEVKRESSKVECAKATESCIFIVSLQWVYDSISKQARCKEEAYSLFDLSPLDKAKSKATAVLAQCMDSRKTPTFRLVKSKKRPENGCYLYKTHYIVGYVNMVLVKVVEDAVPEIKCHTLQLLHSQDPAAATYAVWKISGNIRTKGMIEVAEQCILTDATTEATEASATSTLKREYIKLLWEGYTIVNQESVDETANQPLDNPKADKKLSTLFRLILPAAQDTPAHLPPASSPAKLTFGTLLTANALQQGKILLRALENLMNAFYAECLGPRADKTTYTLIQDLLEMYYSLVPLNPCMVCDASRSTLEQIQDELGMHDSRLKSAVKSSVASKPVTPWGNQLKVLNLCETTYLPKDSNEYKYLSEYFIKTLYKPLNDEWREKVDIFRIEREGEMKATSSWVATYAEKDNRRLLWHGTPAQNVQSILKTGLSDPYARRGIYFSDTANTSLGFARKLYNTQSQKYSLFFLCEVQLGRLCTDYERYGEISFTWIDAGFIRDELKGALIPDMSKSVPAYAYTEWIAMKASQIRHRYIFMLKDA